MSEFFKNAFKDMKESAAAQHKIDKANFQAVKTENKAQWEAAKAAPSIRTAQRKAKKDQELAEAEERLAAAQEHFEAVKRK